MLLKPSCRWFGSYESPNYVFFSIPMSFHLSVVHTFRFTLFPYSYTAAARSTDQQVHLMLFGACPFIINLQTEVGLVEIYSNVVLVVSVNIFRLE
jgi:hypothetical protein